MALVAPSDNIVIHLRHRAIGKRTIDDLTTPLIVALHIHRQRHMLISAIVES